MTSERSEMEALAAKVGVYYHDGRVGLAAPLYAFTPDELHEFARRLQPARNPAFVGDAPYAGEFTNGECAVKLQAFLDIMKEHDPALWPRGMVREVERAVWVLRNPPKPAPLCNCKLARPRQDMRDRGHGGYTRPAPAPSGDGGVEELAVLIAGELARIDGYDPKDPHGGLYDLRWSGGPEPEPAGDAWTMDYLPKAERIARSLTSAQQAAVIQGEVVQIGDDDEGQPRIVIHTTREAIREYPDALLFKRVQVQRTGSRGENSAIRQPQADCGGEVGE